MSSSEKSPPAAITALLGPPPLLSGENSENYNQLLTRVMEELEAEDDIILQLLIKRFVDGYWESTRYTRHRAVLIDRRTRQIAEVQDERKKERRERRDEALERIAIKIGQPRNKFIEIIEREALIESSVEDVDRILDDEHRPTEIEHSRAIEATIAIQTQFEQLIDNAARRQDSALILAERYAALKQQRTANKGIVEAEYVELGAESQPALAPPLAPSDEATDDVGTQNSSQPAQQPQE
jgi:hypothetical protein